MPPIRRTAAALVALALLLAACSSGGDDKADQKGSTTTTAAGKTTTTAGKTTTTEATPSSSSTTAVAPTTPAGPTPDTEVLKSALLTEADLPDGYNEQERAKTVEVPDADGSGRTSSTTTTTTEPDNSSDITTDPPECGKAFDDFDDAQDDPDLDVRFETDDESMEVEQQLAAGPDVIAEWEQFQDVLDGPCKGKVKIVGDSSPLGGTGTLQPLESPTLGEGTRVMRLDLELGDAKDPFSLAGIVLFIKRGQTINTISLTTLNAPSLGQNGAEISLDDLLPIAQTADRKLAAAL